MRTSSSLTINMSRSIRCYSWQLDSIPANEPPNFCFLSPKHLSTRLNFRDQQIPLHGPSPVNPRLHHCTTTLTRFLPPKIPCLHQHTPTRKIPSQKNSLALLKCSNIVTCGMPYIDPRSPSSQQRPDQWRKKGLSTFKGNRKCDGE